MSRPRLYPRPLLRVPFPSLEAVVMRRFRSGKLRLLDARLLFGELLHQPEPVSARAFNTLLAAVARDAPAFAFTFFNHIQYAVLMGCARLEQWTRLRRSFT